MISSTEVPAAAVPPEISEAIGQLHADVEKLQRELVQALDVWQTTLTAEKTRFDELLAHKELAWQEQEHQWERQTQGYEERLEVLKTDFEIRLKQTEQNAAHALAELDDDWQRDKLSWGPKDGWVEEKRGLEEKIQSLEKERAELQEARAADANRDAEPTPSTVKALQGQLLQFQQTVASFQDRAAHSDELVNACVQALDYQISVLYDLLQHYAPPAPGNDSGQSPPLNLVEP